MGFSRFIYNDSKNPDSIGPLVFHMNFPRAVFRLKEYGHGHSPAIVIHSWIDQPTPEQAEKTMEAVVKWAENFFQQQFNN